MTQDYIPTNFFTRIHAIIFVMASGRMCLIEENFMKELMETFFDDNNLRHRLLLVVTHSAEKYIRDIHRAQEWITNESNKPRSLLSYFFNDVNLGQNSCKSRIHFTNFKNPKEEEDPGMYLIVTSIPGVNRKKGLILAEIFEYSALIFQTRKLRTGKFRQKFLNFPSLS